MPNASNSCCVVRAALGSALTPSELRSRRQCSEAATATAEEQGTSLASEKRDLRDKALKVAR